MSISIYTLVRSHLLHRLEERGVAAIETITASVEFEPNGLEWEENVRELEFGQTTGDGAVVWGVFDLDGHRVDGSQENGFALIQQTGSIRDGVNEREELPWNNDTWSIYRRVVRSNARLDPAATSTLPNQSALPSEPNKNENATPKRYQALVIAVGVPVTPALRPLNHLAIALVGISVAIWLLAAVMGKWLCARALDPLIQIAHSANRISAADFSRRVPSAGTGDELDDLAIALNDLLNRLQISFEQQRRFAAEASHQLRTPLTAILGQLEVALRRQRSTDEYRQALESAHRQADLLRQIVESLLFLTRESADATQIQFERLELHNLLPAHLEVWRPHPRFSDLRLEIDDDRPLWVSAQRVLLEQALDNLIDNACKYSEPNSPICIRAVGSDGKVRIEIEDAGSGISATELPHVFDPFFRGADSRQHGVTGFGLGLSVAQKIAVFFGGRMEIESTKGCGCRVAIVLPAINQSFARTR